MRQRTQRTSLGFWLAALRLRRPDDDAFRLSVRALTAWTSLALVASTGACSTSEPGDSCGHVELEQPLLILEGDLRSASALGVLGTDGCFIEEPAVELGRDPALADAHGRAFVASRDRGQIAEVFVEERDSRSRPRLGPAIAAATPLETSPNPWDVDVDTAGRLWIARYDLASLGVVEDGGE